MTNKTLPPQEKYYTPTIEEFHQGFEFERYNSQEWFVSEAPDGWEKDFYNLELKLYLIPQNLSSAIEKGWVRVKYLDREDIESLLKSYGWDVLDDYYSNGGYNANYLSQCEIKVEAHHGNYPMLFIHKKDGKWFLELNEKLRISEMDIKNKSELRKVMQMVGIGVENES